MKALVDASTLKSIAICESVALLSRFRFLVSRRLSRSFKIFSPRTAAADFLFYRIPDIYDTLMKCLCVKIRIESLPLRCYVPSLFRLLYRHVNSHLNR